MLYPNHRAFNLARDQCSRIIMHVPDGNFSPAGRELHLYAKGSYLAAAEMNPDTKDLVPPTASRTSASTRTTCCTWPATTSKDVDGTMGANGLAVLLPFCGPKPLCPPHRSRSFARCISTCCSTRMRRRRTGQTAPSTCRWLVTNPPGGGVGPRFEARDRSGLVTRLPVRDRPLLHGQIRTRGAP